MIFYVFFLSEYILVVLFRQIPIAKNKNKIVFEKRSQFNLANISISFIDIINTLAIGRSFLNYDR